MPYLERHHAADSALQKIGSLNDLEANVEHAIRATGRTVFRGISVNVQPDAVVLLGRVPTYYEKQLAQAAAQQVADRRVVNEIAVVGRR